MAESFIPLQTQNLANQTSITQNIDSNFNSISVLFNDVLSRSGVSPNQMVAALDMNNNPIINLPVPNSLNSPARLADINSNVTPTPSIISGSNVYTGNNTFVGNNTFSGTTTISGTELITGKFQSKNGYPWVDVTAWGATGVNNAAVDTPAIQNAINYACSVGNAIVFFPQGTYGINATLTVATTGSGNIVMQGASQTATVLQTNGIDVTIFDCTAGTLELRDMLLIGKGINDSGTYGATQSIIVGGFVSCWNVRTLGGYRGIQLQHCGDIVLYNFYPSFCYGDSICYFKNAAGWWIRVKADQAFPNPTAPLGNASTFGNWASSHVYNAGDMVIVQPSGAVLQCMTGGTSSGSQPLPANYNINITESSGVVWQLMAPSVNYTAITLDSGANQNYLWDIDMTGCFFKGLVLQDSAATGGPVQTVITASNVSPIETGFELAQGNTITIENCNFAGYAPAITGPGAGSIAIDLHSTYGGNLQVVGNTFLGGFAAGISVATGANLIITNNLMSVSSLAAISINAGVNQFVVKNNIITTGGTTAIALGGSNSYYVVSDNIVSGKQVLGATTTVNSFAGNNF